MKGNDPVSVGFLVKRKTVIRLFSIFRFPIPLLESADSLGRTENGNSFNRSMNGKREWINDFVMSLFF